MRPASTSDTAPRRSSRARMKCERGPDLDGDAQLQRAEQAA
jgi:hypothetical protein